MKTLTYSPRYANRLIQNIAAAAGRKSRLIGTGALIGHSLFDILQPRIWRQTSAMIFSGQTALYQ